MAKEEIVPRLVRMPKALLDKLAELAAQNRRSANAEIVYRLEESLRVDERKAQRED